MSRIAVRTLVLSLAAAVLAVGCTSTPSPTVTVTGTLGWSGGVRAPHSPPYHVMPGALLFTGHGKTYSASADESGHFTTRLPRGTYVVTGVSAHFVVNGVEATCRAIGGPVDASRDRSGVLVLCIGT
ncbi:MAG: hypothetical protein QOD07_487 [Frankiaceae bacterium]|jgi:hypothetical protein|nr:hypothetical protein [Frankiaceae bacterium]